MCGIAGFCNFKEDFEENTDYWNFRLEAVNPVRKKKRFYQADYKIFIDKKGRIALLLLHEVR